MSQSAISNRLNSNFGRVKDKELDLHTKLSIQAKQNALPKGNLSKYKAPKILFESLVIVPKKNYFESINRKYPSKRLNH